jgi:hypothetical protein
MGFNGDLIGIQWDLLGYTLREFNITMENDPFSWMIYPIYPLKTCDCP